MQQKNRLSSINNHIEYEAIQAYLKHEVLYNHVKAATIVLDCTDNFRSRFAINKACVDAGTPMVSGAASKLSGQLVVFDHRQPACPCYRCLYDQQNDEDISCSESGVLGPVVGTIGAIQALEAIKLISGFGDNMNGRLMLFDAMSTQWRTVALQADPECPVCS